MNAWSIVKRIVFGISKPYPDMTRAERRYSRFRALLFQAVGFALLMLVGFVSGLSFYVDVRSMGVSEIQPLPMLLGVFAAFFLMAWWVVALLEITNDKAIP